MAKNIVIGFGGTGAKCIEAFFHVFQSGLVENPTSILMADQDRNNGNANHTISILKKSLDLSKSLQKADIKYQSLQYNFEEKILVPISLGKSFSKISSPESIEHLSKSAYALYQGMYSKREISTDSEKGFYSNPYVGHSSLKMSLPKREESSNHEFWNTIDSYIPKETNESVKVFLMGSIFGGTGASILPATAEYLKEKYGDNIELGAILMLPYFSINSSEKAASGTGPMSDRRVALALRYYGQNLLSSTQSLFKIAYLIGMTPKYQINNNLHAGGPEQKNEPMMPELLAGTAAAEFFNKVSTSTTRDVAIIGRSAIDKFLWSDIPENLFGNSANKSTKKQLRIYVAVPLLFLLGFYDYFSSQEIFSVMIRNYEWFSRLFGSKKDNYPYISSQSKLVRDVFFERIEWFNSIADFTGVGMRTDLDRVDLNIKLLDSNHNREKINNYIKIYDDYFKETLNLSRDISSVVKLVGSENYANKGISGLLEVIESVIKERIGV